MKLQPLSNKILIAFDLDPDAPIEKIGELVMPAGFKPAATEGAGFPYYPATALVCGPDCTYVKPGDKIAVHRNNVEKFSIGLETFWQIAEMSVAAIIKEP